MKSFHQIRHSCESRNLVNGKKDPSFRWDDGFKKGVASLIAVTLLLAACARGGPPAPVEVRGIGTGETSPSMAGASASASNNPPPVMGGTYTPPPGYGNTPAASTYGSPSVQTQTLGEPNDAYAQAAQNVRMSPPPPGVTPTSPAQDGALRASQPGQSQVLGTMSADTPVSRGVPVQGDAPPAAPATTTTATASVDQGTGAYGWPLRGRLISGFGPKDGGQANDGLNIASPLGTQVLASKEGTVAYAGNELRGFGNMVLVRHSGGMFTVYAHLDQILVSKDAAISKAQVVGTVGQSGGVSEPQLHFEIRRGSTPQDPMKYLSR